MAEAVGSPATVLKLSPGLGQIAWPPMQGEMPTAEVGVRGTRIMSRPPHTARNMSVPARSL